jgi:hypothetical protein
LSLSEQKMFSASHRQEIATDRRRTKLICANLVPL